MNQRLTVYRRMAAVRSEDRARSGARGSPRPVRPAPVTIQNLADYARIRLLADRVGIESIDREGQIVVLKFRPEAKLDPAWLFRLIQERTDIQLTPPATLKLDLRKGTEAPRRTAGGRQGARPRPRGGQRGRPPVKWRLASVEKKSCGPQGGSPRRRGVSSAAWVDCSAS